MRGIEKFKGEIENLKFNTFIYFKPVKRFQNKSGVSEFWSFKDGTSKGDLDLLETIYLRLETSLRLVFFLGLVQRYC